MAFKKIISASLLCLAISTSHSLHAREHQVMWLPLVKQTTYQYTQKYAGRIQSEKISDLGFELAPGTTSTLDSIKVDVGSLFKKGDLLAILDNRLIKQQIMQIEAQLKEAQTTLAFAKLTTKRLARLRKNSYASLQGYDEAQSKQKSLEFKIQALSHQLEQAKIRLSKQSIIAPFDGTVIKRFMSDGALVRSGQTVLQIIATNDYQINIGLPMRYLPHLHKSQQVTINVDDKTLKGKVHAINANRDSVTQSHNVLITTHVENEFIPNQALATIDLTINIDEAGAWVPLSALQQNYRGLWSLYYLKPEVDKTHYKVTPAHVKILFLAKDKAYVQTDLPNNAKIIGEGLMRVVPGEKVSLANG